MVAVATQVTSMSPDNTSTLLVHHPLPNPSEEALDCASESYDAHRRGIISLNVPQEKRRLASGRKRCRPHPSSPSASDSDGGSSASSSSLFSFASSSTQSLLPRDDSPATSVASSPYRLDSGSDDNEDDDDDDIDQPRAAKAKRLCSQQPPQKQEVQQDVASLAPATSNSSSNNLLRSASSVTSDQSDLEVTGAVQAFNLGDSVQGPLPPGSTPAVPSCDKVNLADHLVDAAVATVEAIWLSPLEGLPSGKLGSRCDLVDIPLHLFIRETLRRSRTSCSTLQAALLYCLKCAAQVRAERLRVLHMAKTIQRSDETLDDAANRVGRVCEGASGRPYNLTLICYRRFFLAALISATKFLQDRNFSNRAWSKITGLPVKQLGCVERDFLQAIDWHLNIPKDEWDGWTRKLAEAKVGSQQPQQINSTCSSGLQAYSSPAATSGLPPSSSTPTPRHATPIAKPISALPDVVRRLRRSPSPISRRSGSCTPTPSNMKPAGIASSGSAAASASGTPMRSLLSRSHSDDAAFLPFDSAILAPPTPQRTVESSDKTNVDPVGQEGNDAQFHAGTAPAAAAVPALPAPFPMHRTFVRSALSFSAATGTQGSDRLSALKQEHL